MSDLGEVGSAKLAEVSRTWGRGLEGAARDSLIEYCRLYERKAKADAQIREHGELVAGPNGFPVENPWMAVSTKASAEMRKIARDLEG